MKPRLRRSFALPSPSLVLVLVIDLQSWPARPWGLTLSGEAQREAPAQTELRPTFAFARASHHNRARACPRYRSSIVASSIMGLTLSGEAQREAPAQTELRPTFARAAYRNRARARPRYRSSIVASTRHGG